MKDLWDIISLLVFCSITVLPVSYGVPENKNGNIYLPKDLGEEPLDGHLGRIGLKSTSPRFWPNAKIPYTIDESYSKQEKDLILKAMNTIQFWTCIQFVPWSDEESLIVIENIPGDGCWSFPGRVGNRQVVHLESWKCFKKIGQILYVLLYAVGLVKEHNRSERDDYITINTTNIMEGFERRFEKYPADMIESYGIPYDYNSVMHYPEYALSSNGEKTIIPKIKGTQIGQRDGMSVRDALTVMKMYNCKISGVNVSTTDKFSKVLPNYDELPLPRKTLWDMYFRNSTQY